MTAFCASITSVVFSDWGHGPSGEYFGVALGLFFASIAVPALLAWRHRAPFLVTLVAAGVAVVLPVGTSTALFALVSLVACRSGSRVWWTAGAVGVATMMTAIRDVLAETMAESFPKTMLGPTGVPPETPVELSWWFVPLAVALPLGPAIRLGLVLRARRHSRAADRRAEEAVGDSARLGDEFARQVERERIAREVHDALGHRLSLLSLHAGALEVNAQDDDELARSAALVRASVGQSVADLHSLLCVLRQDPGVDHALPKPSLVDPPAVIDETVRTGVPVSATVDLDQAEAADPALARAVDRIVQELLTNARKHAPGAADPPRCHRRSEQRRQHRRAQPLICPRRPAARRAGVCRASPSASNCSVVASNTGWTMAEPPSASRSPCRGGRSGRRNYASTARAPSW